MDKKAERLNVLTEGDNKNFIHSILNAVTKGYSDNTIIDDVIELVRSNEISQGVLSSAPEALRSYRQNITNSLNTIADEIEAIEVQEAQDRVVRRKRLEEKKKEHENKINKKDNDYENDEENENEKEFDNNDVDVEDLNFQDEENDEDKEEEDEDVSKQSKIASKDDLIITENWENSYDNENKKIAGVLNLNFNQDVSIYKVGDEIILGKSVTRHIKNRIFSYFKDEYPQMKVELTSKIFKGNIIFEDIKNGKAFIEYEINNPF